MYFGSPQEAAITFFTSVWGGRCPKVGDNLAEWMLDLVVQADRKGEVKEAAAVYRSSQLYKVGRGGQDRGWKRVGGL